MWVAQVEGPQWPRAAAVVPTHRLQRRPQDERVIVRLDDGAHELLGQVQQRVLGAQLRQRLDVRCGGATGGGGVRRAGFVDGAPSRGGGAVRCRRPVPDHRHALCSCGNCWRCTRALKRMAPRGRGAVELGPRYPHCRGGRGVEERDMPCNSARRWSLSVSLAAGSNSVRASCVWRKQRATGGQLPVGSPPPRDIGRLATPRVSPLVNSSALSLCTTFAVNRSSSSTMATSPRRTAGR
jgi:hypothetical protein